MSMSALPAGLPEFYQDAMKRIQAQAEGEYELAKKALSFIFGANRPLSPEVLCHALATKVGDS